LATEQLGVADLAIDKSLDRLTEASSGPATC
jgi:hypothetical protein